MRFLADHMLGSLARWMRFLGFDCTYPEVVPDKELGVMAKSEDRVLLTRDKDLANVRDVTTLYILSTDLKEQILQVVSAFDLKIHNTFSRCSLCNNILTKIEKDHVKDKVPEKVFSRQDDFWECKVCQKYYWHGTHYREIKKTLENLEGKTPAL